MATQTTWIIHIGCAPPDKKFNVQGAIIQKTAKKEACFLRSAPLLINTYHFKVMIRTMF